MALSTVSSDTDTLALLGKKQVLKRRFGFWSLFGFAVCELITWETVLALFSQGFDNGGPAGLIYGFIIAWSSTLSVYTVISELASLAPIAGGQYYWVYMLAPPKWKVFSSYIIGWLTSLAWVATVATETIFAGTMLQGLVILDHSDYNSSLLWRGTFLAWAVLLVCVLVNVIVPGMLPKFEVFIIIFHISGFIAIVATLWATAPHSSSHFVWSTALNEGGWPTQGLSYCVGFLGNVATFVGADASVHLAEEVAHAAKNIPRAIICSMCLNGAVGFIMMITILYCLGDVDSVLSTTTGYPFIQVFAIQNTAGASVMVAVVLCLTWACAIGITTTASRMTWSFARDKGTPFSHVLGKVAKHNQVPIIAACAVAALAGLLHLIYIGSSVAFNDVVSLTITGFYSSYFLPAIMLLYRRVKGQIGDYTPPNPTTLEGASYDPEKGNNDNSGGITEPVDEKSAQDDNIGATNFPPSDPAVGNTYDHHRVSVAQATLIWGPFHLPGWIGIINNAYACSYMIFVIFWSVWPPTTPVTSETMNYSVVVTGGVIIFSIIWYFIRGRHEYHGPLIDDEVAKIMRRDSIVQVEG
ncbi:hypothetical protein DV736_g2444, partial [Chaetothyriales sp. CBS 134916]